MQALAKELHDTVEQVAKDFLAIPELRAEQPVIEGDWSAKEMLGHLIDSAANNHARFVRAQFTDDLIFEGYDQEQWVKAQRYGLVSWAALVALWKTYNLHLAHVIDGIPETILSKPRARHTLDTIAWQPVSANETTTLAYLIQDYIGHLKDHIGQIVRVTS